MYIRDVRWRVEWESGVGFKGGDNARTIMMTKRATVYSELLIREFVSCCVLRFENCAATWFAFLRDSRLISLPSLYVYCKIA